MLDRLLHHGHVLKCGPRSWRTKMDLPDQEAQRGLGLNPLAGFDLTTIGRF
jgi:hypothetical protein